jgi:hypothetical protein
LGRRCFDLAQPSIAPKRLSFAAMLRDEEGEGVLLTELACQSDWGPTHLLPQPGVHYPVRRPNLQLQP